MCVCASAREHTFCESAGVGAHLNVCVGACVCEIRCVWPGPCRALMHVYELALELEPDTSDRDFRSSFNLPLFDEFVFLKY